MPERHGREFCEGWLSPLSRSVALDTGWSSLPVGAAAVNSGLVLGKSMPSVVEATSATSVLLFSDLLPEPLRAPRHLTRGRDAALRCVRSHQILT